jgi:hypothetical protein
MRRSELEHVLRAASRAVGLREFLVIGSASILGTYPESALPMEATRSDEADLAVFEDPVGEIPTEIEGAIGELSPSTPLTATTARVLTSRRRSWRPAGGIASSATRTGTRLPASGGASSAMTVSLRSCSRSEPRIASSPGLSSTPGSSMRQPFGSGSPVRRMWIHDSSSMCSAGSIATSLAADRG